MAVPLSLSVFTLKHIFVIIYIYIYLYCIYVYGMLHIYSFSIYIHIQITQFFLTKNCHVFVFSVFVQSSFPKKKKRRPFRRRKKVPAFDATKKFYQRVGSLEDGKRWIFFGGVQAQRFGKTPTFFLFFGKTGKRGWGNPFFGEVKQT